MPTEFWIREGFLLLVVMGIGGMIVTSMCRGRRVGVRGIVVIWLTSAPLPLFVELTQAVSPLWGYGIMAGILAYALGILAILFLPDDWFQWVTENLPRRRALS
jgi:hypothetical protein